MTRLLLFGTLLLVAAQGFALSLEQAVRNTLATNPNILASEHSVDAAEDVVRQAQAGYLPSVDVILAAGEETSNNATTRAAGVDERDLTREERSVRVTQMLYDGFATRNSVAQQRSLLDAATSRLVNTEESTALRAVQAYLEVLRRNEIVELAQANLSQHEDTLSKIRERFESGVGTRVDVVQTRGRQAQSRSNLLLAQRNVSNGEAQFLRVVGAPPQDLSQPDPIDNLPSTLGAALEIAYRTSPRLLAAQAELDAATAARRAARAPFHPRFDLEVGATRNDDTDGTLGANDDEMAVVRMTYNLYRGGGDKARLNETQAREFAARENLNAVRRAVTEDITLIWNELQDIRVRLEYLEGHVTATEEVLKVYNEQLTLGKRTLLDLLDMQNELLRARVAYVSGKYTERFARYRILAALGNLLNTMEVPRGRNE